MSDVKVSISQRGYELAYPKNCDVKDVRLGFADRVDDFLLNHPGETAFWSLMIGIVVAVSANWLSR